MNRVVQTKTITAMIHMGMREPFVLDSDGTRYVLPADASRRSGQTVSRIIQSVDRGRPAGGIVSVLTRFDSCKILIRFMGTGGSPAVDNTNNCVFITSIMKTLQVRIPEQLRADADSVLADIGLDLPTAVRLYLTKIVQTRSIPFSLEASPIRSEQIPVDAETQAQMDAIATAWKHPRA